MNSRVFAADLTIEPPQADRQRCHLLVQIVMQFARYMFALFLLRDDQFAGQILDPQMTFQKVFFSTFTLGDIAHHTDQPLRSSILGKTEISGNLDPADLPISTLKAVHRVEYLPMLHAGT